jgi:hypothetical protein
MPDYLKQLLAIVSIVYALLRSVWYTKKRMPRGILSLIHSMLKTKDQNPIVHRLYRIAGPRPRPHRHVFRPVVRNGVAHVHNTIHIPR